jgi:hypothetical protein
MQQQFKIEKKVPLPNAGSRFSAYPFEAMEVGDSFAIATREDAERVRGTAYSWAHRNGKAKLTIRRQADGTYRCWRIE